ncbi:PAS domain S-box protein [Phenylobacterium sp. LH3H17]|uniref:HWE histidine kinase domain-containing protein n=1 Tax=Phenylobacterium sp. LH3H17 TaxID=2903901 RepID=UPI0020CA14B0|nr:HWE histidine kinase domain-containing protein [Phenylobacterium sp. LH3H17]UTP38191.1 PAS domain S-box protein [Phenylobacterium sp. LH3H17]
MAEPVGDAPLREFYEASPDAVVVLDQAGHILFANSRVEPLLGYLPRELVGKPHSVLMPARYRDTHAGHIHSFMDNPTPRMMGAGRDLVASRKDGSEFLTEISLSPYHAPDGLIVIAAMRDREALNPGRSVLEAEIADLKDLLGQAQLDSARMMARAGIEAAEHEAAQRLQGLLLEELHHRMKNMLATVIGITSQTLRAAETLEEGRHAISGRLVAMGRAQDLLLRARATGAGLADVISAAIEPFDSHEARRFVVQDTLIEVGAGAILPLTMSINELCTNAVKYGALSNDTGRVSITSTADETTQLFTLTWTETGGPMVQEPTRRSFGTRLLGALATQLHGDVRVRYEPTGVVYDLAIPLALLRTLRAN